MKNGILITMLLAFGLTMFSSCAMMTGETAGENIDDTTIHANISSIIVGDPDARYLKIDATVTKGDVVLTGFVNSTSTESRIVSNIKRIKGVKSVKSILRVEKN